MAPAGSTRQLSRNTSERTNAKIRFMWTIPLKSDKIYGIRLRCAARRKINFAASVLCSIIITGLPGCYKSLAVFYTVLSLRQGGQEWYILQRRRAQAAGLAAQAPLHDSVSGRQPRKLRPAGAVPGDRAVRRQGTEPWRQRVPCVPGQRAGAGGQDLSLLRRCGKSG